MKKIFYALAALAMVVGCENTNTEPEDLTPAIKFLTESPYTVSGDEGAVEVKFDVTASWSAEVENGGTWCTLSQNSGEAGSGVTLVLNLEENNTGVSRSAGIKIRSEKKSASLILTQEEVTKIEFVGESSADIIGSGEDVVFEFSATKDWTAEVTTGKGWCTIDNESGSEGESNVITASVARNIGEAREAVITISSCGKDFEYVINQGDKVIYNFRLGDYYPFPDKPEEAFGIVYRIENDGLNGMYVSIAEGYGKEWGAIHKFEANDKSNGLINTATIKSYDPQFKSHAVFDWVDSLNNHPIINVYTPEAKEVWYLPAIEELEEIYNNKSTINFSLEAIDEPLFNETYPNTYWSSTEGTEASAAVIHFKDGLKDYAHKIVGDCRYQRAVARF